MADNLIVLVRESTLNFSFFAVYALIVDNKRNVGGYFTDALVEPTDLFGFDAPLIHGGLAHRNLTLHSRFYIINLCMHFLILDSECALTGEALHRLVPSLSLCSDWTDTNLRVWPWNQRIVFIWTEDLLASNLCLCHIKLFSFQISLGDFANSLTIHVDVHLRNHIWQTLWVDFTYKKRFAATIESVAAFGKQLEHICRLGGACLPFQFFQLSFLLLFLLCDLLLLCKFSLLLLHQVESQFFLIL